MVRKQLMRFETKVKLNLHKRYFDIGYGLTQYFKYLIILFGISSLDVKKTLVIGLIYGICCYILGFIWLNTDFYKAEIEVSNQNNLFVKETREMIKEWNLQKKTTD